MSQNMITPYGDTKDDGQIQLCFTLPVQAGAKAKEAASQFAMTLNCDSPKVVHMEQTSPDHCTFVVYAKAKSKIDYDSIEAIEVESPKLSFIEINQLIKEKIKRKIVVVGACTGFDAHTVGIDAIMNMKGWKGDYGLERYPMIEAHNLGAQVQPQELFQKAKELKADAVLISKVVDQKDIHIQDLQNFQSLVRKSSEKFIIIAGGPRVSHALALELGYDAGFGTGTTPSDVASYIAHEIISRG